MTTSIRTDWAAVLQGTMHHRKFDEFETRTPTSSELILTGYASVFDTPYAVYGGPPDGFDEIVDRKAFDATLATYPDLNLLINHEGISLARTKSGTLSLSTDDHGFKVHASLDRANQFVQSLESAMRRGDMDQMSFAFRTMRDKWNADQTERKLLEVSLQNGDVSVVNFGASPATHAELQRALRSLGDGDEAVLAELRSSGVDLAAVQRNIGQLLRQSQSRKGVLSVAEAMALLDS